VLRTFRVFATARARGPGRRNYAFSKAILDAIVTYLP
jgi:hypothetical protein